jgi:hypothetical protein
MGLRRVLAVVAATVLVLVLAPRRRFPTVVLAPQLIYDKQIYGDFIIAGNSNLVCPTGNATCAVTAARGNTNNNNDYVMTNGGANPSLGWFNSSSVSITIPPGARVDYAELSWSGDNGVFKNASGILDPNPFCDLSGVGKVPLPVLPPGTASGTPVQLKVGASAPVAVTATRFTLDTFALLPASSGQNYSASAAVTGAFAGAPTGVPLTVARGQRVDPVGYGCYGGWSLILVYAYDAPDPQFAPAKREIFLYDGHVRQEPRDPPTNTTISGFKAQGAATVGWVAYEGDWGFTGDQLKMRNVPIIQPATNANNNFFISSAANQLSPNTPNNFSVDASSTPVPTSVIGPGDTSVPLSFTTNGDTYLAVQFALSVPVAELVVTKSVSPNPTTAGSPVTYTITVRNPSSCRGQQHQCDRSGRACLRSRDREPRRGGADLVHLHHPGPGGRPGQPDHRRRHECVRGAGLRHGGGQPRRGPPGARDHQGGGQAGVPGGRPGHLHRHRAEHGRRGTVQRGSRRPGSAVVCAYDRVLGRRRDHHIHLHRHRTPVTGDANVATVTGASPGGGTPSDQATARRRPSPRPSPSPRWPTRPRSGSGRTSPSPSPSPTVGTRSCRTSSSPMRPYRDAPRTLPDPLAAGASTSYQCTAAPTTTLTNSATVTATDLSGQTVTGTGAGTVAVIHPAIALTKTPDQPQHRPGETVTYTLEVTNTGDAALTDVAVHRSHVPHVFANLRVAGARRGADLAVHRRGF